MKATAAHPPCAACGSSLQVSAQGICPTCLLKAGLPEFKMAPPVDIDPTSLGPAFRLIEKIGEGGLAEVFLAEQLSPVRREVAIKRLKSSHNSPSWHQRFQSGFEALSRLDHPGIAAVFAAGTGVDQRPFQVLELVEGIPLTNFCDHENCTFDERLELFEKVCDAVGHAHQQGVLHGDLKPANILAARGGPGRRNWTTKLIDFGAARWLAFETGAHNSPPLAHFGTPGYASPEQCGGFRPPDGRSDVFSLGAVLRDLLTPLPGSFAGEAGWIVRRAMQPIPENRYETAAALSAEIQALRRHRPLAAGPDTLWYRTRKLSQRHWPWVATLVATLVLLSGGASYLVAQSWKTRRAEKSARLARRFAEQEFQRARSTEDLVRGLAQALQMPDRAQRSEHLRHLLAQLGTRADQWATQGQNEVAFSLNMSLAVAASGAGRWADAERHFLKANQIADQPGMPPHHRWGVQGALAKLYLAQRRPAEAEALLTRLTAATGPGAPLNARVDPLLDLSQIHLGSRRLPEAEAVSRRALHIARQDPDPLNPLYLKALHGLAGSVTELRRYVEARELLLEATRGFQARFGPDAPETRDAERLLEEVEQVLRNQELLPKATETGPQN